MSTSKVKLCPEFELSRTWTFLSQQGKNQISFDSVRWKRTSFDHFGQIMSQAPPSGWCVLILVEVEHDLMVNK